MPENRRGLVQVYTGDGKGKTTAALGLALRAVGNGMKVGFIQFLKGERGGEHLFAARYHPFEIIQVGTGSQFGRPLEELADEAKRTLKLASEMMSQGNYDLLVLDEICVAVHKGFLAIGDVLAFIESKPASLELVLTGRYAPPELIERADLVTEMKIVKHPFQRGIPARKGVEY